jgi:hypothetical protein
MSLLAPVVTRHERTTRARLLCALSSQSTGEPATFEPSPGHVAGTDGRAPVRVELPCEGRLGRAGARLLPNNRITLQCDDSRCGLLKGRECA